MQDVEAVNFNFKLKLLTAFVNHVRNMSDARKIALWANAEVQTFIKTGSLQTTFINMINIYSVQVCISHKKKDMQFFYE